MKRYSCGHCGYILPGPGIQRCPRCGVLLEGEREGTEAERRRRDREYHWHRPEAVRRREKMRQTFETIGNVVLKIVVLMIFTGGGAAVGRFALARLIENEAATPLTVGGAIMGAVLLYALAGWWKWKEWEIEEWRELQFAIMRPHVKDMMRSLGYTMTWKEAAYAEWERKMEREKRETSWTLVKRRVCLSILAVPLLGTVGWFFSLLNLNILSIVGGAILAYFSFRIAKRFKRLSLAFIILFIVISIAAAYSINQVLATLFPPKSSINAVIGLFAGITLAFYVPCLYSKPTPDIQRDRCEALLPALMENPARIRDLNYDERQYVLSQLRTLAKLVPELWETLPVELQRLIHE